MLKDGLLSEESSSENDSPLSSLTSSEEDNPNPARDTRAPYWPRDMAAFVPVETPAPTADKKKSGSGRHPLGSRTMARGCTAPSGWNKDTKYDIDVLEELSAMSYTEDASYTELAWDGEGADIDIQVLTTRRGPGINTSAQSSIPDLLFLSRPSRSLIHESPR